MQAGILHVDKTDLSVDFKVFFFISSTFRLVMFVKFTYKHFLCLNFCILTDTQILVVSLTDWLMSGCLTVCLAACLTVWLPNLLSGWLTDRLSGLLTDRLTEGWGMVNLPLQTLSQPYQM